MVDTQAEAIVQQLSDTAMTCMSVSAMQDIVAGGGTAYIESDIRTQLLIMQTFAVEYPAHARRLLATVDASLQVRMREVADQIAASLSNG